MTVAAVLGGVFPAAAAAQEDDATLTLSLRLANAGQQPDFLADLQLNCTMFFSDGQVPNGARWVYAQMKDTPVGALDFGARRGEARLRGRHWQVGGVSVERRAPGPVRRPRHPAGRPQGLPDRSRDPRPLDARSHAPGADRAGRAARR